MTDEPIRRQRRRVLTDLMVGGLKRKRKRYILADPELGGHYVRVPPEGPVVFAAVARHDGKQVWTRVGDADELGIEQARDKAREVIKRVKAGLPAFEPPAPPPVEPDSFADVSDGWLERHVRAKGLRSGREMERILKRYALPVWRDRPFKDIRRSDIVALLDDVEDEHGKWTADAVLSVLRNVSSWFASRNEDYVLPFTKKMRRTSKQERQRTTILSDAELRVVWSEAQQAGGFGAFLQMLLLTAQRRDKVATLQWTDIEGDVWTIATKPGEKGNPRVLRLPPLAMKIIEAQPRLAGNPHVFAGRGKGPMSGFSKRHLAFKKACKIDGDWTLHDCRRSARSLMSRAGVLSEHAERVLGHAIIGVEGVYNQHHYTPEKADALAKLAALIESIVHPPPDNVVQMRAPAMLP
jgi:integrase